MKCKTRGQWSGHLLSSVWWALHYSGRFSLRCNRNSRRAIIFSLLFNLCSLYEISAGTRHTCGSSSPSKKERKKYAKPIKGKPQKLEAILGVDWPKVKRPSVGFHLMDSHTNELFDSMREQRGNTCKYLSLCSFLSNLKLAAVLLLSE